MENNKIALSDVERNKELFEYEMTEVVLQLKGEFAKLSGKDLNLENVQVSTPKVNVGVDIPDIEREAVSVEMPESVSVSGNKINISAVTVQNNTVDCPTVPAVEAVSFKDLAVEKIKLDCPAFDVKFNFKPVSVEADHPAVADINTDIKIPQTKNAVSKNRVDLSEYYAIPVPNGSVGISADVKVQKINVDVPDAKVSINNNISVDHDKVSATIPVIPKAVQFVPKKIEVTMPSIDVKNVTLDLKSADKTVTRDSLNINYPSAINIPDVQSASSKMAEQMERSEIRIGSDINVPDINVNIDAVEAVKTEKTNIDFEYSAVPPISLPDIEVQKITGVEVPELPDLTDAINELLGSAV